MRVWSSWSAVLRTCCEASNARWYRVRFTISSSTDTELTLSLALPLAWGNVLFRRSSSARRPIASRRPRFAASAPKAAAGVAVAERLRSRGQPIASAASPLRPGARCRKTRPRGDRVALRRSGRRPSPSPLRRRSPACIEEVSSASVPGPSPTPAACCWRSPSSRGRTRIDRALAASSANRRRALREVRRAFPKRCATAVTSASRARCRFCT